MSRIFLLALLAAGCASPAATVLRAEEPGQTLAGAPWSLRSFGEGGVTEKVLDGGSITIRFTPEGETGRGRANGNAGCNTYFSSYEIDGSRIRLGPAGSTMMYCGEIEGLMDQERRFLKALEDARTCAFKDGNLLLRTEDPADTLLFAPSTNRARPAPEMR